MSTFLGIVGLGLIAIFLSLGLMSFIDETFTVLIKNKKVKTIVYLSAIAIGLGIVLFISGTTTKTEITDFEVYATYYPNQNGEKVVLHAVLPNGEQIDNTVGLSTRLNNDEDIIIKTVSFDNTVSYEIRLTENTYHQLYSSVHTSNVVDTKSEVIQTSMEK